MSDCRQTVKEPLLYTIVARLIAASRLFARLQNSYGISTLGFAQTHQRVSPFGNLTRVTPLTPFF